MLLSITVGMSEIGGGMCSSESLLNNDFVYHPIDQFLIKVISKYLKKTLLITLTITQVNGIWCIFLFKYTIGGGLQNRQIGWKYVHGNKDTFLLITIGHNVSFSYKNRYDNSTFSKRNDTYMLIDRNEPVCVYVISQSECGNFR